MVGKETKEASEITPLDEFQWAETNSTGSFEDAFHLFINLFTLLSVCKMWTDSPECGKSF